MIISQEAGLLYLKSILSPITFIISLDNTTDVANNSVENIELNSLQLDIIGILKILKRNSYMNIEVEPRSYLSEFIKENSNGKILKVSLEENAKILDVLKIIGIPKEKIHLIIINNMVSSIDSSLKDGDKVIFYPLLMGG